jgi:hypothetical protein
MNIKTSLRGAALMVALVAGSAGITAIPAQAATCCWKTYASEPYGTQAECEADRAAFDASSGSGIVVGSSCVYKSTAQYWYYTYKVHTG